MLTLITISIALAAAAPDAEPKEESKLEPIRIEQAVDMSKRLSSADIARLLPGRLPDYCEAYAGLDPVTGDQQCEYVVCRPPGGFWSLHECWEFGL